MGLIGLHPLTVNAFHEARGEPDDGVIAVCKVVLNRAKKNDRSIREVIYRPYQFSWTLESIKFQLKWMSNPFQYCRCRELSKQAIEEHESGDTYHDADHYHKDTITPYWAADMKMVGHIGAHIFYKSWQH